MSYTHKPTNPEDETRETDREVFFNHNKIVRVTRMQKSPQRLGLWVPEWDTNRSAMGGKPLTLRETLVLTKSRHQSSGEAS